MDGSELNQVLNLLFDSVFAQQKCLYWVMSYLHSILSLVLLFVLVTLACNKEESKVDCSQEVFSFEVNVLDSECGLAQGAIEIVSKASSNIVRYRLDDGAFSTSATFHDLLPGFYTVSIENVDGCTASREVLIRSGISFKESVEPIIRKSCAISSCHDGSGNVDYREFSNFNPSDMKARTQSRNMPKEGTLTQAEIDAIGCWVDDGALNN